MASPPAEVDVGLVYSFELYEGYSGMMCHTKTAHTLVNSTIRFKNWTRKRMVDAFVEMIRTYRAKTAGVGLIGAEAPHILDRRTVTQLRNPEFNVKDCILGEMLTLQEAMRLEGPTQRIPARQIPGSTNYECVYCGSPSDLVTSDDNEGQSHPTHLMCGDCLLLTPLTQVQEKLFVDLRAALKRYKSAERFFINLPWNPTAPWMSRNELEQLLPKKEI